MGLNVNTVYEFVQFVSNKEFRGWINPDEFNLGAEIAQLTLYSELEAEFAITKKVSTDMRPFLGNASVAPAGGLVAYSAIDSQFRHPISSYKTSDYKPVWEKKESELPKILDSTIVNPTLDYPIVVYRDTDAHVFPTTLTDAITFVYLKSPNTPEWVDTGAGSRPVYDSGASTDFDFEAPMFIQIVARILPHVGMNLKEEQLAQYGIAFEQKGI
jgi:hypothetical protein